ncbi:hypothetical protein D3C75_1155340 [compost metagenome]
MKQTSVLVPRFMEAFTEDALPQSKCLVRILFLLGSTGEQGMLDCQIIEAFEFFGFHLREHIVAWDARVFQVRRPQHRAMPLVLGGDAFEQFAEQFFIAVFAVVH